MKKLLVMSLVIIALVLVMTGCNRTIEFTVNFETNGGSAVEAIKIDNNTTTFTMPDDPERAGYTFEGWFFDDNTFSEEATVAAIIDKLTKKVVSITVYAKWSQDAPTQLTLAGVRLNLKNAMVYMYTQTGGLNSDDPDDVANFIEVAQEFVNMFSASDIALLKLNNLANFMLDYDYSEIMVLNRNDNYVPDPSAMLDFIYNAIEASGFTSSDLGKFLQKGVILAIDENIIGLHEYNDYLEAEIERCYDDIDNLWDAIDNLPMGEEWRIDEYLSDIIQMGWYIEYCEEKIENINLTIQVLTEIRPEITSSMIRDVADILIGVSRIFKENQFISQLFNLTDNEDMPTITELATLIASFSDGLIDLSGTSAATKWVSLMTKLGGVVDVISDIEGMMYFGMLEPLMSINPFDYAAKLGQILGICDLDMLNAFLNEIEEDGKRKLEIDFDNDDFFNNLVILEAKLITILTDGEYDPVAIEEAYDQLLDNMMDVVGFAPIPIPEGVPSFMPYALQLLSGLLKDKVIISSDSYDNLLTIAEMDFGDLVDPALYEDTVICSALLYVFTVKDELKGLLLGFDEEGDFDSICFAVAAAFYAFSIDIETVNNYIDKVSDIDTANNSKYVIASFVNELISEDVFTVQQLSGIIAYVVRFAAQYGVEVLPIMGITSPELLAVVIDLADSNESLLEDMVAMFINLVKLASGVVADNVDPDTGEIDMLNIVLAIGTALDDFKDIYSDISDQEGLCAVISALVIAGYELIIPSVVHSFEQNKDNRAFDDANQLLYYYYNDILRDFYDEIITEITIDTLIDYSGFDLVSGTEAIDNKIVITIEDNELLAIYSSRGGYVNEWTQEEGWDFYIIDTNDPDMEMLLNTALMVLSGIMEEDGIDFIDKLIAITDEFAAAAPTGAFEFEEGIPENFVIYLAKVIVIVFGDDISVYQDIIEEAGEGNIIGDLLLAIEESYADIKAISAGYDYDDILEVTDYNLMLAIINILFG